MQYHQTLMLATRLRLLIEFSVNSCTYMYKNNKLTTDKNYVTLGM